MKCGRKGGFCCCGMKQVIFYPLELASDKTSWTKDGHPHRTLKRGLCVQSNLVCGPLQAPRMDQSESFQRSRTNKIEQRKTERSGWVHGWVGGFLRLCLRTRGVRRGRSEPRGVGTAASLHSGLASSSGKPVLLLEDFSTAWMRPTHILKGNLSLKSADLGVTTGTKCRHSDSQITV